MVPTKQKRFFSGKKTDKSVEISNPCIDGVFQYGFSEPSILSDFLNAALELREEQSIEDIQYLPKDMTSSDPMSALGYHFTVDVRCRTKEGSHFLVEMQNDFRDDYHLKSLVEHARMLSRLDVDQNMGDQAQREENNKSDKKKFWKGIQGLYTIVITNKTFPLSRMKSYYSSESVMEPLLVNPYELRHTKQLNRHYGDVPNQIVLLMLDNLTKSAEELSSPIERWAYLFKDSSLRTGVKKILETKKIQDPEVVAGPDKAITAFIDRVSVKNLPQEVRDRYIRSLNYYNTTILDIEDKATERGVEQGIEQGIEIGVEQGIEIVAKNMLKSGKPIAEIMEMTGLSEEQIKNLDPVNQHRNQANPNA
jgi:predicted transposase/invertase (TIGR01784 family)